MHLSVGCQIEVCCQAPTPMLALVHPHSNLMGDLQAPEQLRLDPDRTIEVLADQAGNRWSRWLAPSGSTTLRYSTTLTCSDSPDPVLPSVRHCPIQVLPIDTYRFLNPSPYCDTAALMALAWGTFGRLAPGWPLVQAICDWVHGRIRFEPKHANQAWASNWRRVSPTSLGLAMPLKTFITSPSKIIAVVKDIGLIHSMETGRSMP
jgi:hypothetical protein